MQAGLQAQSTVHLPGRTQGVPLGDGPPGVGQHVRPVLQGLTRGPGTKQHLAHRLSPKLWAPGPDGQHQVHALGGGPPRCMGEEKDSGRLGPKGGWPTHPSSRQPTWIWLKGTRKVKASLK